MAWIGKDASDGSEGKEDSDKLLGLRALDIDRIALPIRAIRSPLLSQRQKIARTALQRQFVKVELEVAGKLTEEQLEKSNSYWEDANMYGLLDTSVQSRSGATTLVLSVKDEAEARQLVEGDPSVAEGAIRVKGTSIVG